MERRQFERTSGDNSAGVEACLLLNSFSLVHEGRDEEFELEAKTLDLSRGGVGLQLNLVTDFLSLHPNHQVRVGLFGKREHVVSAVVVHFEEESGMIGLRFNKPLESLDI